MKGARASGASRWVSPSKAIIQLSLRYRWEDHFWFSFFHEGAHVYLHGKRQAFIDLPTAREDGGVADGELEAEANRFAADILIPRVKPFGSRNSTAEVKSLSLRGGLASHLASSSDECRERVTSLGTYSTTFVAGSCWPRGSFDLVVPTHSRANEAVAYCDPMKRGAPWSP